MNEMQFNPTQQSYEQKLNDSTVKQLTNVYYSCDFIKVIQKVDALEPTIQDNQTMLKLKMLKAKALYELNRVQEAMELLRSTCESLHYGASSEFIYVQATQSYFEGQMEKAKYQFKMLSDLQGDRTHLFKAILGLGNIAYSTNKFDEAFKYLKELKELETGLDDDYKISRIILEGNAYLGSGKDATFARECFEKAYMMSVDKKWYFFAQRSLYYLAKWHRKEGNSHEAKGILGILDMHTKTTDSRFLSYLTNLEFSHIDHHSTQEVQLDKENMTVTVGHQDKYRLELARWPLLFKFVETLCESRGYVSKKSIASHLWPDQEYKPRLHDPRIYDIVARLKRKLEMIDDKPLVLSSGPKGYRINFT